MHSMHIFKTNASTSLQSENGSYHAKQGNNIARWRFDGWWVAHDEKRIGLCLKNTCHMIFFLDTIPNFRGGARTDHKETNRNTTKKYNSFWVAAACIVVVGHPQKEFLVKRYQAFTRCRSETKSPHERRNVLRHLSMHLSLGAFDCGHVQNVGNGPTSLPVSTS